MSFELASSSRTANSRRWSTSRHSSIRVSILLAIGKCLHERLRVEGATTCVRKRDYQGTYFRLYDADGYHLQFWMTVLPAGGRYNVPGHADSVNLRIEDGASDLTDERLSAGGFHFLQDRAGYRRYQTHIPLGSKAGHIADPAGAAESAADHLVAALRGCDPPLA